MPDSLRSVLLYGLVVLLVLSNAALFWQLRAVYVLSKQQAAEPHHARRFAAENERLLTELQTPTLILFGDSRIAQWSPEPDLGSGASTVNRGISGETTEQMRVRFRADVLQLRPSVVIIQAGINDLVAASLSRDDRQRQILARCIENLAAFAQEAASTGIRVVLLEVIPPATPPLYRRPFWDESIRALVEQVNASMAALDADDNVTVVGVEDVLLTGTGSLRPELAKDTLHFTTEAYSLLNQHLSPLLQTLLTDAVQ